MAQSPAESIPSPASTPAPVAVPRSEKDVLRHAMNEFLGGDDITAQCPQCNETLLAAQQWNQVLVACPNACIGDQKKLRSDPGGPMRLLWGGAAVIIIGLALLRGCVEGG